MTGVNKAILIGHIGADPEIKSMHSGDRVANFSIATSECWKDKATGERKERTQWHRIVVFNQALVGVVERFLKKGSKVYIEGQIETRSWDQNGQKHFITEIVLRPFRGEITMLDSRGNGTPDRDTQYTEGYGAPSSAAAGQRDDLENEIPF